MGRAGGGGTLKCDHFDFEGAAAIIPLVSSAGHRKASLNGCTNKGPGSL